MVWALLRGLLFSMGDILLALGDIVARRRRRRYCSALDIAVPPEKVWDLILREEITYTAFGLKTVQRPLEGRPDAVVATMELSGRDLGKIAFESVEKVPEQRLVVRYLPELCDHPERFGDDDVATFELCPTAGGSGTRLTLSRELTHRTGATRIGVPIGVRQGVFLLKSQAESEAGIAPSKPPWWHQVGWAVVSLASFAVAFGWTSAAAIMLVILVHEVGHALAMAWFGLGVRLVSFIPFFGGVTMPRRMYATDWQHGIVALLGVGLSLPFAAALVWFAESSEQEWATELAAMAVFINGFNLLPVPGLDGSTVVELLVRRLPKIVGRIIGWAFLAAMVALAVVLNAVIVWVGVVFSVIVMVQKSSLRLLDHRPPLGWASGLVIFASYSSLFAAYIWLAYRTVRLTAS